MAERKNLTITEVNEIQKVGDKQIPKLSFKARGNEAEEAISYFTFKSSLFDYIKIGQTITADIETEQRGEYTNRRIVQVYKDGQGVVSKGQGRSYGKSPEELEQQARLMILAYSKDLVVADKISLEGMLKEADRMYTWLKMTDKIVAPPIVESKEAKTSALIDMDWLKESLEELNWADVSKWLKSHYHEAKGTTVKAIVESLTREHQEEFVTEVQTRVEIQRNS